ncbi:pyruvate dehydrogenase (acetyl-transferring) E1 component subunit alpha [Candidatus Woesearchaeota archaeon]|nr:pyruvate dehydrogenase (acetyl-transferring) E1 component subunit alpha [Candidatus Woesearchaeota archaeon]
MDEKGEVDGKLMPKFSSKQIKDFYESMYILRAFDKKAVSLQRQGRLGTYPQITGMEATQVGTALALQKADWMFPSFRESGAMIARGIPMSKILLYWGGDERGSQFAKDQFTFPISIPVGSQTTHAVGTAWGMKIKGHKKASLVYFGDGATSRGDFHEAMNFASVMKAPCVFICNNNQFAISTRPDKETASETFAQKAIAYGMEGVKVDGNDVFGVYKATQDALKKAYSGKGPTLIECYTYRMLDHTTSDDASRYRSKKEVDEWAKKDPIDRLRKYMEKKKLWTKDYEGKLYNKVQKMIEKEVEKMENITPPDVKDIFKYTYAEMDDELKEQMSKYG